MAHNTISCRTTVVLFVTLMSAGSMLGQDERRPSRAFYFDWISSQYEGSTEAQSLTQLEFFEWLHDEYGMVLDIYSLDVGNIDDGPFTVLKGGKNQIRPDVYLTAYPAPFESKELVLSGSQNEAAVNW